MPPKIREDLKKGLVALVNEYKNIIQGTFAGERGQVCLFIIKEEYFLFSHK
jgi:hypothetical protein